MIRISTKEEEIRLMKIYYQNGIKWMGHDTFVSFIKNWEDVTFKPYNIWDMETCKDDGIIRQNDCYRMSVDEYLNKRREQKLERILK
jgi:hypothetical protein